jgi:hypothetical protein
MAVLGVRHTLGDAEISDLGILEHLLDRTDRPAGHAGGVELRDPGLGGLRISELAKFGIERIAVPGARRRGGVSGAGY